MRNCLMRLGQRLEPWAPGVMEEELKELDQVLNREFYALEEQVEILKGRIEALEERG